MENSTSSSFCDGQAKALSCVSYEQHMMKRTMSSRCQDPAQRCQQESSQAAGGAPGLSLPSSKGPPSSLCLCSSWKTHGGSDPTAPSAPGRGRPAPVSPDQPLAFLSAHPKKHAGENWQTSAPRVTVTPCGSSALPAPFFPSCWHKGSNKGDGLVGTQTYQREHHLQGSSKHG